MASVKGMDRAMISPGRTPRLMKLTASMMAIACHSDVMNSADGAFDRDSLIRDEHRLDADAEDPPSPLPSRV